MRLSKVILISVATTALLAASLSSADARGYYRHRGPGPVLGLLGGIVVGAATIATLPFAVLADAARSAPPPSRDYYGQDDRGYGPPQGGYQGGYGYGPSRGDDGYAYERRPPPPRAYRNYGPPPGYYGGYGNGY